MSRTLQSATAGINPDIVIKHQFDMAKPYYVQYTLDHNGKAPDVTSLLNDYDVLKSQLAKKKGQFNDYLEYGARNDVTKLEEGVDSDLTPTFTQDSYNLSKEELRELEHHVQKAAKNKNLMWKTVISFSDDFLIRQKIMDNAIDRHLDQRRLKSVVQKVMPELLAAEGIDQSAEWFGNVHLYGDKNKKHVHIHLGTFEQESSRPLKFNVETKRMEPKGMFKQKTIDRLKASIWRDLRLDKEIEEQQSLMVDKEISTKKLLKSVSDTHYMAQQKKLLDALLNVLPDEKETKWRAGSNAVNMKAANKLANTFVDNLLSHDLAATNASFEKSTAELEQIFKKGYGDTKRSYQGNQRAALQKRLINRLYQNLRELGPDSLTINYAPENPDNLVDHQEIKNLLEAQVKELEEKKQVVPKALRKELGKQKRAIRLENLQRKQANVRAKLGRLEGLQGLSDADSKLIDWHVDRLNEQNKLLTLQQTPNFKLSTKDRALKADLETKYMSVQQTKIQDVTEDYIRALKAAKDDERELVGNASKDALEAVYETNSRREILSKLDEEQRYIKVKGQIKENNDAMVADPSLKQQLRRKNAELFKQLAIQDGRKEPKSLDTKTNQNRPYHQDKMNQHHIKRTKKLTLSGTKKIVRDMEYAARYSQNAEMNAKLAYEIEQEKLDREL